MATYYRPVECKLDHERFNALMSELAATGEGWEVAIDRGTIVLQGEKGHNMSPATATAWSDASRHMSIHVERKVIVYKDTRPVEEADAAWAEAQGARGLRYVTYQEYWDEKIREEQETGSSTAT